MTGARAGGARAKRAGALMRGAKSWALVPVVLTGILAGALVVPAPLGAKVAGPGTLEICKDAKNGMAGKSFPFRVDGGAPITVVGGGCSGALSIAAGTHTIVEGAVAGFEVAKIAANHKVSVDPASRTAVVEVKANSTPATETLVTYTNRAVPAVGLKICKATPDATLLGDLFSFTQNGARRRASRRAPSRRRTAVRWPSTRWARS